MLIARRTSGSPAKPSCAELADGALAYAARTARRRARRRRRSTGTPASRSCRRAYPRAAARAPRSMPGIGRHDHPRNPHRARDRGRVERPGPAEREQREAARVVAVLERDHLDRAGHVLVRDLDDRGGELQRRQPDRSPSASSALATPLEVEPHPPAEEVVGIEPAEQQVGVGDGRPRVPPRP